ncbi:MAG: NUMOD3 domain-containing DNA-binding protein [Bacilli bacterium]|nr:NUMOD3 domain-containing DNA-binding protein [Bacilli bacterium]
MDKKYLIYKFTSPSGKSYIGQTCDLERRIRSHKLGKNGCIAFNRAIEKYDFDNFTLEILEDDLTLEEANLFEELYIIEHNTFGEFGYNLKHGGNNKKYSEESVEKMRKSHTGKHVGEKNPMYGKKHTEESIEKNRQSNIGKQSGKNNAMYGKTGELAPAFGIKRSEETNEKNRQNNLGEKNPMHGKIGKNSHSSKSYIITFPDGNELYILCLAEFCRNNNLLKSSMGSIAKGKMFFHKGFKCRYATEQEIVDNQLKIGDNNEEI